MASNLSTIGFVFANNDEFAAKMVELAADTQLHASCAQGHIALWQHPTGAQLWFHIGNDSDEGLASGEKDIKGLAPFFEGKSDVAVKITKALHRRDDNDFEGGFYAWVGPDDSGEGVYPIVFDAVDYALQADRATPFEARIRLSGFARELKAFASREDYENGAGEQPKLAAQAFIPMGLFAASAAENGLGDNGDGGDGVAADASPTALLTGIVADHHLLRNDETGQEFHWLLVDSLDASFDIIADPETVSGTISKGGIIEVACWFFGRFLDDAGDKEQSG